MEFSEILNLILGGGFVAAVIGLFTLRATVRKANAEAEAVRIDNADHATRILIENIVEPLREELDENRKVLQATKREMARLRKAIDTANSCRHHDDCPVLAGLHKSAEEHDERGDAIPQHLPRRRTERRPRRGDTGGTALDGEDDPAGGQPP